MTDFQKHKHDAVIRAWLDGREIQVSRRDAQGFPVWQSWTESFSYCPDFSDTQDWRIAPKLETRKTWVITLDDGEAVIKSDWTEARAQEYAAAENGVVVGALEGSTQIVEVSTNY